MKRWFWSLILMSALSEASAQEALYINVDPICMDRYEYHINGESKGVEYIAYRVRQSQRDNIFLEVGSESSSMQLSMPESKDCRNVFFSPDFIEKINTKEVSVFIVRKAEIGYNISPVNIASYQYNDNNTLKYKSYGLDFFCNLSHSASGTNLAQDDSASEIYFGGEAMDGCVKEYHFRKMPKETCKPNVDIDYIPEVGVVREIVRVSKMNDKESMLNLVRINDVSLDTYISRICQGKNASVYMPTTYAVETTDLSSLPVSEIVIDGQTYGADGNIIASETSMSSDIASMDNAMPIEYSTTSTILTSKGESSEVKTIKPKAAKMVVEKPKIVAAEGHYIVAQGETLYGIARKNGLTVEQLKAWNNLTSDNLALNSDLKIVAPPSTALVAKSTSAMKKTVAAVPKSYEETTIKFTSKGVDNKEVDAKTEIKTTEKIQHHTVAPGETISGLAKQFGYTETRFRSMNSLASSDIIKVGQILKITDCICPIPADYAAPSRKIQVPADYSLVAKGGGTTSNNKKEAKVEAPKAIYKRMTVHIVTADETLEAIASKYNVNIKDLLAINGFEEKDVLIPNQRIFVD